MILYGNGSVDDTAAIRSLLRGAHVLDARYEVEIAATSFADLPQGLYRVKVPSRHPIAMDREGWTRRTMNGDVEAPRQWQ